ncbi:MAG: hypothetical protein IIB45_09820 [Candidatus Marinimicrobia bacterium]|nr:hypothetical protein [Candidatus Neomarinimicrobiota bacterium]
MSVAVIGNLSDGVILGVDSAITVPASKGSVLKVYENAEKLFPLGSLQIGIAIFGLGAFGNRTIGSYLREFELTNWYQAYAENSKIEVIAEQLRLFLYNKYCEIITPELEVTYKKKFEDIPDKNKPGFGLIIGGFSPGEYLSEVRLIVIPKHDEINSTEIIRQQGSFGTNWFATFEPIRRYFMGYDSNLINDILRFITKDLNRSLNSDEKKQFSSLIGKHEYKVPFNAMPIDEGINHIRFLVELVINHHKFTIGAPVVGGRVNIGMVSYNGRGFQIIKDNERKTS